MALVYPIYLDTPMMTAFLASLQGGVIEETNLEHKTADTTEKARSASVAAKVGGLLSGLLEAEARGDLSKKMSESLESHYKSTVRFPSAYLFIRLRDLLLDQDLITPLTWPDDLTTVQIGDLVEFQGLALANPAYQIRTMLAQLLPLVEPVTNLTKSQIDQRLGELESTQPGKTITYSGRTITLETADQIAAARNWLEGERRQQDDNVNMLSAIGELSQRLFPVNELDVLLFESEGYRTVCHVYPAFARNERLQDIYDATWNCVAKVIGIVPVDEQYDLLKGSPLSYLAQDVFTSFVASFNNPNIQVQITDPRVSGPALITAPLAIFA